MLFLFLPYIMLVSSKFCVYAVTFHRIRKELTELCRFLCSGLWHWAMVGRSKPNLEALNVPFRTPSFQPQ